MQTKTYTHVASVAIWYEDGGYSSLLGTTEDDPTRLIYRMVRKMLNDRTTTSELNSMVVTVLGADGTVETQGYNTRETRAMTKALNL